MPAIPYITKKFGRSHLVWFQNSNMYFRLEEPAWFVFSRTTKRYKAETIASEFATRYDIAFAESLSFVKNIRLEIQKRNRKDTTPDRIERFSDELKAFNFTPFSIHHYQLGDKVITFSYETRYFEYYLHPLICHFETPKGNIDSPHFELFAYQERIIFRFNGAVKGSWTKDETHRVKGLIFMFLINVMHDKTDADWLMTVHASAITNGKKTILFSAPPGNGKTTIAALLQTCGYRLISDDFVPIDRYSFKAYPFPIAMSVKEGTMDLLFSLFPALEHKKPNPISKEKRVRYLQANQNLDVTKAIFPVHEIIFIHYDHSVDFSLEKLDPVKALKLLLDQAWVTPVPGNPALLLDRVLLISFYQLTYSNNQKALDAITSLFYHDE